jgi:hypothetical protein
MTDVDKSPYVTVYRPVSGWKSVLMTWDEECGCHLPAQTGFFAHPTKEKAVIDARMWAEAEDIRLDV